MSQGVPSPVSGPTEPASHCSVGSAPELTFLEVVLKEQAPPLEGHLPAPLSSSLLCSAGSSLCLLQTLSHASCPLLGLFALELSEQTHSQGDFLLMTQAVLAPQGTASGDESRPPAQAETSDLQGDVRHSPALSIAHRERGTQMRPENVIAHPPRPTQLSWVVATKPAWDVLLCVVFLTFIFSTWTKPLL